MHNRREILHLLQAMAALGALAPLASSAQDIKLGESPTQREAVCQGHPLELDQAAKAAGEGQPSAYVPPTYTDPEKARELIDAFKQGMIPRHPRR